MLAPVWGMLSAHFNPELLSTDLLNTAMSINVASNLPYVLAQLYEGLAVLFAGIISLFTVNPLLAVYVCFVVFYVVPFLYGLADLPIQETLFGYMSSLTRYGFSHSYIRKLGKSALLQLFKTLIMLPFTALILFVVMQILSLTVIGGGILYLIPFILVFTICGFFALKRTFLSGWIPAIVVYDCNMFKGLKMGLKAVFRRFWRTLSTALVITLIVFAINYLFGLPAVLIIAPISIMIFNVFEMVMFFGSQGMRYYVDLDTIVTPKLLEEKDSFRKIKNII